MLGDGIALTSVAHPRLPWYRRVLQWFRPARLSPDSLEDVEIQLYGFGQGPNWDAGSLLKPGTPWNDINLACSSAVEPRPVKPVVEGSNPSAPATIVDLFADTPAVCEPYDNGFAPELFQWEPPCGDDCDLCGEW